MKRVLNMLLLLALVVAPQLTRAQLIQEKTLDATIHGTTIPVPPEGLMLYSENQGGHYVRGNDYYVTITGNCPATDTTVFYFHFDNFDVGPLDTVFIYDGPSTTSPLLWKGNNSNSPLFKYYYASANNVAQALTIRFKTRATGSDFIGWSLSMGCRKPCASVTPVIDRYFVRYQDGVAYDTAQIKMEVHHIDTAIVDGVERYDTIFFPGINVCMGDGIKFFGHGEYDAINGYYTPSDATTEFRWFFGTGDTLFANNATEAPYQGYFEVGCFPVVLSMIDANGCQSILSDQCTVRVAQNPLKTIYDLATICTTDSLYVSVGYDGDNATLTLTHIEFSKMASKTNAVKTFIPDGPQAFNAGCVPSRCYTADVDFNEFPVGRQVQSAADICSICVNFEHSYMGDYSLSIVCPTGQESKLKFQTSAQATAAGRPSAAGGGGGRYTGYPYGGNNHGTYDWTQAPGICDSTYNMYGHGYNYCFSMNPEYTLVTGQPCGTTQPGQYFMTDGPQSTINYTFPPIPAWMQNPGTGGGAETFPTLDSSDHDNKMNYYMPANDFSELVGCPLNGIWSVKICDEYGIDNGWVFEWTLDICGLSSVDGCDYQVGIDSVAWGPDTAGRQHYDIYNGKYRGLEAHPISLTESYFLSPDTSGIFPVVISLFDHFGCRWDTNTRITITRTPTPNLGHDSVICGDKFVVLDAKDYFEPRGRYTYMWDPYGQTTDTIRTTAVIGTTTTYAVEVTNTQNGIRCQGRDTVQVGVSVQPIPNFDPGIYPLEGCEPFTVDLKNSTINATRYEWVFGDGVKSTEVNPRHTYSTGVYDFKFYAYSDAGCVDSLVYPQLVTVYSSPDARFSWEPAYPTVSQPYVNLINRTTPDNPEFDYFWNVQYDKDYPYSVHTLPTKDTSFTWETNGRDISGDYMVRLIARSKNLGPSGNIVYCADTAENSVLIINDFLQFPNVVTPNGDGVNDRFVILNLVNGQAYPTNCLDIYNKWGARVYHKENISKDEDFWDPKDVPAGTYFFRFSAKGYNGNVERNGAIEVLK